MAVAVGNGTVALGRETEAMRQELGLETLELAIGGLSVAGFLVLTIGAHYYRLDEGLTLGPLLIGLAGLAWALRRRRRLIAAWVLVVGCLAEVAIAAAWLQVGAFVILFSLPVGLAAILTGMGGGALIALTCTLWIALAPGPLVGAGELRALTAINLWATLGLIGLTTRTWLTALQWAWSTYEQNRRLLERSRDSQVQLKQALGELAEANLQLTRLNHLAQGLRQAAEEARRTKEQFVANVSHELRTPLNMIIGFAQMIVEEPDTYTAPIPPALLADLEVILRNARHLSSLVDDVLDLSQVEAGRVALVKERVSLEAIIEDALVAVHPLFESKGLYLKTQVAKALPPLLCDPTRIREVLLNLLSNAGRFTERGGVWLRAWQEGSDLLVSVTDTGPGIARAQQERLFRPFEQLDASLGRRHGGTGLGLAISRSFVELHGGKMWLESEEGQGTTFLFRLPIDPPLPPEAGPARWLDPQWEYRQHRRRAAQAPTLRPRLVLCEQGHSLLRLIRRYREGAEIVAVTSVEEALAELARAPSQALLVNDAQVSAALDRLMASPELPYGTPAVICSVPGTQEAAAELGASDYLVKPISREALLRAIDRLELRGKRVLVVDDEPEAQRLFWRMLTTPDPGCRVFTASTGAEALRILREQRPDGVLLDLVMPEMDGFQFLSAVRADPALSEIPIVLISARDPAGHAIVSGALAITRQGGLSVPELLALVDATMRVLGKG